MVSRTRPPPKSRPGRSRCRYIGPSAVREDAPSTCGEAAAWRSLLISDWVAYPGGLFRSRGRGPSSSPGFRAPNHDREALPSHRWALPPPGARYKILEQKPYPIQAKVCSSIAVRLHRQSYTSPFEGPLRLLYASSTSRHVRNFLLLQGVSLHTTGIHR